ncbi:hypothetical protein [Bdellovibrio svalbardensis]|uniref:EfeO-type cupredoxin-like domain-containing protein n=1 Tax=Bdellovibrio svalbardensis TaxID=2972972 RepID=A0ABT6DJ91_9BACT|nr:hypothetical protein [Bdellovibrio svalbardensis]MDG0815148.1 hypothetical protein [Bdellovibrio svalbardensis]
MKWIATLLTTLLVTSIANAGAYVEIAVANFSSTPGGTVTISALNSNDEVYHQYNFGAFNQFSAYKSSFILPEGVSTYRITIEPKMARTCTFEVPSYRSDVFIKLLGASMNIGCELQ